MCLRTRALCNRFLCSLTLFGVSFLFKELIFIIFRGLLCASVAHICLWFSGSVCPNLFLFGVYLQLKYFKFFFPTVFDGLWKDNKIGCVLVRVHLRARGVSVEERDKERGRGGEVAPSDFYCCSSFYSSQMPNQSPVHYTLPLLFSFPFLLSLPSPLFLLPSFPFAASHLSFVMLSTNVSFPPSPSPLHTFFFPSADPTFTSLFLSFIIAHS